MIDMIDIQAFHKVRDQYKILSRREKFVASKAIKRTIKNLSFHIALLEQEGYKKEAEQIEEAINILQGCHSRGAEFMNGHPVDYDYDERIDG